MSVRKSINEHPAFGFGIGTLGLAVAVVGLLQWHNSRTRLGDSRQAQVAAFAEQRAFYTVDDGATWFEDSVTNFPPFQKDGRTAYGVLLGQCGDEAPFIMALYKFDDAQLVQLKARLNAGDIARLQRDMQLEMLMRSPLSDEPWIKPGSTRGGGRRDQWAGCSDGLPRLIWNRSPSQSTGR